MMWSMNDYSRMTNAELIERLKLLDATSAALGRLPGHEQADSQTLVDIGPDGQGVLAQARSQPERKSRFQRIVSSGGEAILERVHSEIPLVFRAFASACTAREQCVLTLPSEHPIAAAVSATSNSSQ